uniref:Peptidase M12B domain-containing protein n=1 Tax=Denticeps clupeoides TaxID=299321 RepID=A0AAY4CFI9_9TELE
MAWLGGIYSSCAIPQKVFSELIVLSFMYFSLENVLQGLSQYEVIHPVKVNSAGNFISNCVSHHVSRIQRRETSTGSPAQVFYSLFFGGQSLYFNLTLNPHLLAPGFVTERRNGGGMHGSKLFSPNQSICYFLGEVLGDGKVKGQAAISTCDGLTGLFKLAADDFFIKPLEPAQGETVQQAHVIYRRRVSLENNHFWCVLLFVDSIGGLKHWELGREYWESQKRKKRRRRILQRSISREKWVETLVVADSKMVEYHGKGVENYVLSVMNIVAGLFRDASIGNAINIVVVRLILLEQDEEALKITHHADHSLSSFCKWQKRLNPKGDDQPLHHDVAVLLTSRKDICALINSPCETLGLSHVAGMCQPHRSCSINEDTGLPVSFTVAHELGHNFGIQHDGNGNDCEPVGKKPFIMSPQLLYGSTPNWSQCSRQYITRFLDRGWGWCLDDPPVQDKLTTHTVLPGVLYTAAHQCRLQYGSGSLLCDEMDNICSTLWCTVGSTCHSKLDGAVDGTKCGEGKWCYSGECISIGSTPERVNGGWGQWSKWSACSRTCGMGVQNAQRDCTNPAPQHRGRYCLGERLRYRICSTDPCPPDQPGFRYVQCGQFNSTPYKGKLYEWVHVNNRVNLCELHCRPLEENFSEKMRDAVIDGTPCYEGSASRDICINGICKSVGCDYQIDSNAIEDRCGVCHGNGSTCETVTRMFERSEGQGYVDVALIPAGARDIRIMEVAESGNFLALRSSDPDKYFLNGGWTIQWTGDYKAAGTVFTYERTGNLENLTSPGPTMEPLWVQLLFQEMNPGVRYEYTISKDRPPDSNSSLPESDFQWVNGTWTECSVTCGTGVKQQAVHCIEMTSGIVEPHYCDSSTRPHDKWVTCKQKACPSIWWAGEWQKCSASCGKDGLTKRTVLCIQSVGQEEQRALQPSECQHLPRPKPISPCNTDIHCPASWSSGNWSECSVTCSHGLQRRDVFCLRDSEGDCDEKMKPDSVQSCHMEDCLSEVDVIGGDWSGSGSSSNEVLSEINSIPEDNSVPTFAIGTTRAQPKGPNDVNNIMNEGVIYSNHIHKTSDNAIKNILCSTSCGLGATWRSIICSSGNSFDCELSKRPAPARRCYLRPCSAWRTGNWNKCSRNCSGGVMQREVQCYDIRTGRSLRPFHCQAISSRPAAHTPCNSHPCMDWYTSSWGQCSELCGGGEQQRLVACPESEECDVSTQPSHIQPCNTHTCSQWVTGSWGQCSVSCGGGIQRRLVKCVNSKAEPGKEEEEDEQLNAQCDHEASPENMQQCNMQDCDTSQDGELDGEKSTVPTHCSPGACHGCLQLTKMMVKSRGHISLCHHVLCCSVLQ